MYILFENFRNIDSYLWQRLMAMGSKGEWVHCEIVFNEMYNIRASAWNSTGMEFRQWETNLNPKYHELYPIPSENWEAIFKYCQSLEGNQYDKLGVFGMIAQVPMGNDKNTFCSEMCYRAINEMTSLPVPNMHGNLVSPTRLRRMLINRNIKPVPLSVLK